MDVMMQQSSSMLKINKYDEIMKTLQGEVPAIEEPRLKKRLASAMLRYKKRYQLMNSECNKSYLVYTGTETVVSHTERMFLDLLTIHIQQNRHETKMNTFLAVVQSINRDIAFAFVNLCPICV
jgi:hypothetical protein